MENKITYLGVDFGTSNCMACAINSEGLLEFAKLEGDSHLLPTVLFVPRVDFFAETVDQTELVRRLAEAREEERRRHSQDTNEIQEIIKRYDDFNKPRYPVRPQKPKSDDFTLDALELEILRTDYENSMQLYGKRIALHQVDLDQFQVAREAYAKEQKSLIRPISTEDALKRSVLVAMQRESSEEAEAKYWNQTFFSAITEGKNFVFGRDAINMYAEDPMGGFFMRSPKSFLASELKAEYKNTFANIVEKILLHVKLKAEYTLNKKFNGVVLGRPINYHGTRGAVGNEDALEIMRKSASNAGFEDVKFFFEPVAAALSIKNQSIDTLTNLIVDVGGGTTDCALIEYEKKGEGAPVFKVLKSGGTRVGGTDFDQAIAWLAVMPYFGRGSFLSSGLPLPTGILYDAIATRDLPAQIRFRKAEYDINNLIKQSASKGLLTRFKNMHKLQAQHKILLEAERIKILASTNSLVNINLSFIEADLRPEIKIEQVESSIQSSISKVLEEVRKTAFNEDIRPGIIFVTGGMSQSPSLIRALKNEFDEPTEIRVLDPLSAVGSGLGLVASSLTQGLQFDHYLSLGLTS